MSISLKYEVVLMDPNGVVGDTAYAPTPEGAAHLVSEYVEVMLKDGLNCSVSINIVKE